MGQNSNKNNGAQNKPAMEMVELAKLAPLSAGATDAEREAYIKAHQESSIRCKERHLEGAWYIGRELPRLKATTRLQGAKLNAFYKERFDFGVRQAQDYIRIAEGFPTKADFKKLLKKANSIRQAVEAVKEEREKKQATSKTVKTGGAKRRQPKQDRRAGGATPTTPLPLDNDVRARLRDAGDALRQIAQIDESAFGRLLKVIQKELRSAKGKAVQKNADNQDRAA